MSTTGLKSSTDTLGENCEHRAEARPPDGTDGTAPDDLAPGQTLVLGACAWKRIFAHQSPSRA